MDLWLAIVLIVAFCVIGFVLGMTYRKKVAEREISSAEDEAKRIINDAIKSAESKKREALVEAKEEIHKSRSEFEREEKARRADLQKQERRLQQKEENLDRKTDSLERKNETLARKIADVEAQQQEIALIKKSQLEMLEKVSGYTVDEAKAYLINALKDEVTHEMAVKVKEIEAQYKDEAEERAREIIVTAIQRCAADHASEVTVSVVPLRPSEITRIIMRFVVIIFNVHKRVVTQKHIPAVIISRNHASVGAINNALKRNDRKASVYAFRYCLLIGFIIISDTVRSFVSEHFEYVIDNNRGVNNVIVAVIPCLR